MCQNALACTVRYFYAISVRHFVVLWPNECTYLNKFSDHLVEQHLYFSSPTSITKFQWKTRHRRR